MLRTYKLRHVVTATRFSCCLSELQRSGSSLRRVLAGPHETDASKQYWKGQGYVLVRQCAALTFFKVRKNGILCETGDCVFSSLMKML